MLPAIALVLALLSIPVSAAVDPTNAGTSAISNQLSQPKLQGADQKYQTDEKPSFVLQTIITICISIVTTIVTSWFQERGRRQQMLQKEFTEAIRELREFSEEITQQVVDHLTANPFSGQRQRTSHSTILAKLKMCGNRMCRAANLLNKTDHALLEKEFMKWRQDLTSAPFPVQKKEFICEPHDTLVQKVHAAHEAWNNYLDSAARDCMNGSLEVPLKQKK